MDFRFRPEDSSPYFFPPNSHNNNYFTEQAMRAGYFNNGFIRTDFFNNSDPVREAIQREVEKERIREEIIAAELIRKRALEAEVRREMAMERKLGFPLLSNSLHFQHNLNNQVIDTSSRLHDRFSISLRPEVGSFDRLPFQRHPEAVKITELKPAVPSITGIKRKITAIGVSGFALSNSKKKPQKEWSCALCKVSATSEKGLDAHLQGRKHKAKELGLMRAKGAISLEIEGSGVSKDSDEPDLANVSSSSILGHEEEEVPAKKINDKESMQKDEAANEHKQNNQVPGEKDEDDEAVLNLGGVENKDIESSTLPEKPEGSKIDSRRNLVGGEIPVKAMKSENDEEETLQKDQNPEDVKKKFKFWCEHCQIGCRNAINMADHERGKKHIAQIQTLKPDCEDVKLDVRKNVEAVLQKKQKTEDFKEKLKYWCEQCQVGCKSEKTLVNHEKGKKHMARLRVAEAVEVVAMQNVYGKEKSPAITTTIAATADATVETSNEEVMENIDGKKGALTTNTTVAAVSKMPEEEVMGNISGEGNEQEALADATTMTHVTDATGEMLKDEVMGNIGTKVKQQGTLSDITTMPIITDATCQMSNEELVEIVAGKVNNREALTTGTTTITDAIFEVANEEVMDFLLMEVNGEGGTSELKASVEDMTEAKGKWV
ncbi:hypothetical protein MKW94_015024 [Papaver nudicaule]|uniref:C2H2-type domain-containing protein n=1 Tax=Papaver nudicaule TaxID=74823 RepID=A0AA41UV18_PAPNU|nr:hypothetical protein [Papaver nudicaule]